MKGGTDMKIRKAIVVPALAVTILGGALLTAQQTQAFWGAKPEQGEFAKTLAQHLGVSEDNVKAALTKMRDEHQQQHVQELTTKLDALIAEGKLTQAQKQAVLTKFQQIHQQQEKEMENGGSPGTMANRKTQRQAKKAELESWAKEQGIDLSLIMPVRFAK
jgi:hypothetical protein